MLCGYCCRDLVKLKVKYLMCQCLKRHYCDRKCQSKHWGKAHSRECDFKKVNSAKDRDDYSEKSSDVFIVPVPSTKPNSSIPPNLEPVPDPPVNLVRNSKGRFKSKETGEGVEDESGTAQEKNEAEEIKKLEKRRKAIHLANSRDMKSAKKKLNSIIGRNKEIGVEWGFQLKCQKNNKFAKVQSNNWESENYNRLANTVADDDDQELFEDFETDQGGRIRRVCTHCKGQIKGPQWSYIKCLGSGCNNGMSHFGCLGFPDISETLATQMKMEYECKPCFRKREDLAIVEADFDVRPQTQENVKKKKKSRVKAKISEKLQKLRSKSNNKAINAAHSDTDMVDLTQSSSGSQTAPTLSIRTTPTPSSRTTPTLSSRTTPTLSSRTTPNLARKSIPALLPSLARKTIPAFPTGPTLARKTIPAFPTGPTSARKTVPATLSQADSVGQGTSKRVGLSSSKKSRGNNNVNFLSDDEFED